MSYLEHNTDRVYDQMRDAEIEAQFDDAGYREWSETIELQSLQQQDAEMVIGEHYAMDWNEVRTLEHEFYKADPEDFQVIDLSHLSWEQVIAKMGG